MNARSIILQVLGKGAQRQVDVIKRSGYSRTMVRTKLRELIDEGLVAVDAEGRKYALVSDNDNVFCREIFEALKSAAEDPRTPVAERDRILASPDFVRSERHYGD